MHIRIAKHVAAGVIGLALALSPAIPAFAVQGSAQSESTVQVPQRNEWSGRFPTFSECARAGRDYVNQNGAIGYTCKRIVGDSYDLWVQYIDDPLT
jgi:hypothetical protein